MPSVMRILAKARSRVEKTREKAAAKKTRNSLLSRNKALKEAKQKEALAQAREEEALAKARRDRARAKLKPPKSAKNSSVKDSTWYKIGKSIFNPAPVRKPRKSTSKRRVRAKRG